MSAIEAAAVALDDIDKLAPFREAVAEVNERFCVVQMGGSVVIASYQHDDTLEREQLYFIKPQDFRLKYANRRYHVGYNTQSGKEIWKGLGEAWLESSMRRTYDRAAMIFDGSECPPDTLNLWRGWGHEPKPGSWDTIADHLLNVVCAGDQGNCRYLTGLLARWAQNPGDRGEVAIVLRGKKGTGKGSVADIIKRWFRHHSSHVMQSKHLTGHFNSHLADCLFLFADEVVWGGDKQGEGALKGLVTEKTIPIEPKGVNVFHVPNRLKILMASNNDWCVPVTEDERRYFVLDVSPARKDDRAYFDQLHAAIEGGEAEAMLHDLLGMDISGFDHRTVPHTSGLNHQKMEGLDSVGRWWASCLEEGRITGLLPDHLDADRWPTDIAKKELHAAYVAHAHAHGDRHPKAENAFPAAWRKLAPSVNDYQPPVDAYGKRPGRRWLLQSLGRHRAEFMEAMRIDEWHWPAGEESASNPENVTNFRAGAAHGHA